MADKNANVKTPAQLRAALNQSEKTSKLEAVVDASSLPTSNPNVAGQLWNDAGTVKVSTGA